MLACKSKPVTHLPRHMRTVHKWTPEAAKKVLLKYNIRKRNSVQKKEGKSPKKHKDYHRRRKCPISNCHTIVRRLPAHLRNVHKLEKTSKDYINALETARCVPDVIHPLVRCKTERAYRTTTPLRTIKVIKDESGESGPSNDESIMMFDESEDEEENEDECSNISESQEKNKHKGKGPLHPVLNLFEEWLASPDGGKRDPKTVKQHSSQLWNMLQAIDDSCDIGSLLDIMLVRQMFIKKYAESKRYEVGTIKSYLTSLRHYFTFLLSDRPVEVQFNAEDVRASREKVRQWSTSYRKETCSRRWQKLEEDAANILTPSNIRAFEKSKAAREAVKVLGRYSEPMETTPITQASYTLVRDFLFTQIFIDNANRPCVLSSMTMAEFTKMRKDGVNYVISIKKHKTAHVHGPAYIVLNEKLKAWLSVFVRVIRTQLATSANDLVFLSWNAQSMTSGQINKAVQSVFKKAGINAKVTSTSFRKAAVTNIHEKKPELSGQLANLMAHDESTAKKYYLLSDKSKASVRASNTLGQLMRGQQAETESNHESGSDVADKHEPGCSVEEGLCSERNRTAWAPADFNKVAENFKEEIKNKQVTLQSVREKVGIN